MATWSEDIELALSNLGGIATLSDIYEEVRNLRPEPHPKSFEPTIRGAIERNSSDSRAFSSGKDLFFSVHGLGAGIWGLRKNLGKTPVASDIGQQGTEFPVRTEQTTYRILRDTELARKIKLLHENTCQLCATEIVLSGKLYAEAHHLKPLGAPHFGPDTPDNIIVVCPNCHVVLDYFGKPLLASEIKSVSGHVIGEEYILYHNSHVQSAP